MARVKPTLKTLTEDQTHLIHGKVLSILRDAGLKVEDATARQVFKKAGCNELESGRFSLPPELVNWAIEAAPQRIALYQRNGADALSLKSGDDAEALFGIGVTNLYYQNPGTEELTPFSRENMAIATRLGGALDEFNFISTPGVIRDAAEGQGEILAALEMLANTAKPIVLLISEVDSFKLSLEMYDNLADQDPAKPFVIPYLNPITPLILNSETSQKMDLAIERGLPVIFSNYGMSGASCPITPGGTLALLTAELIAGLVYGQLKKEGTPMILGSLPAVFNMRSLDSFYSASSMLLNTCCAEMMAHYGIPHCGTSGGSMGWGPELNAASTLWMNHLPSLLGKAGLVPFVGSNFDSMAFSPATVVYAAEVIRLAREFSDGFSVDDEALGVDEIINLGPGGSYLTSKLTMAGFRDQPSFSDIWPSLSIEKWQDQGSPKVGKVLREYTTDLLDQAEPPEDHDEIIARGEEFIAKANK